MATLITGSARLILAMAEQIAIQNNGYIAYMDTDSIFVKPEKAKEIQEFFRFLNPYSMDTEMFKIETDENKNPLDNVTFYGISAKRYCLYKSKNNGKDTLQPDAYKDIKILKYSTHGLGHLMNIKGEQIWKDILNHSFNEYTDRIAVSQITITRPSVLKRFKRLNTDKPIDNQIKPFNFMLIGSEQNKVIPCMPYTKNIEGIQYKQFIDYKTGLKSDQLTKSAKDYWKTLEDVLIHYIKHNDHKFDYIDSIAQRKHIIADRIRYIGKESNNLDEVSVLGIDNNSYLEYENIMELNRYISGKVKTLEFKIPDIEISRNDTIDIKNKIMSIDAEKRKALKINKSTLWYQKKKIKEGKTIKMYNKTSVRIEWIE